MVIGDLPTDQAAQALRIAGFAVDLSGLDDEAFGPYISATKGGTSSFAFIVAGAVDALTLGSQFCD